MTQALLKFAQTYIHYVDELWLSLLIGFLLSGLFNELISTKHVERYLGRDGFKPILISSFIGMLLPVCCFGSLPIAVTLRKKGARLGPVLAFLIATPATSVSALVVCWRLLGPGFTAYIFFAVIIMGLIMGIIGNQLRVQQLQADPEGSCCHEDGKEGALPRKGLTQIAGNILRHAFITLPREIGVELLLGIAIACLILTLDPVQNFIHQFLSGVFGYIFVLIFGLLTYVCSTASVPMADAFLNSGMAHGQAMTYMLVGPITSYGTLLVVRKEFGNKILALYLFFIPFLSLAFGLLYDVIVK